MRVDSNPERSAPLEPPLAVPESPTACFDASVSTESAAPAAASPADVPTVPAGDVPAPTTDARRAHRSAWVSAEDRVSFERILRANELTESGGQGAIASRLVTTAGAGSPASIGRSQLLVSLQVEFLKDLSETPNGAATLAEHGLSLDDLSRLDARGDAAVGFYDAIVRGRVRRSSPLSSAEVVEIRTALARGDTDAIVARFGERFSAATGLPSSELVAMSQTLLLLDPRVDNRFRAIRAHAPSDSAALDQLVAERPELADVRARIDDDRSMAFFLRRPKRNGEHRAAWYTRAARSEAPAYDRLVAGLEGGLDEITTRMHASRTFRMARRYLDRMPDAASLDVSTRDRLLGRMQRLLHGSPAFFRDRFGTAEAPTASSVAEVDRRLRALADAPVTSAAGDQSRSLRAFERRYEQVTATEPQS